MSLAISQSPMSSASRIPIASVIIGDRHRRDFGDLDGLAASIQAEGLLQPIGVKPDLTLVFGERRLRACRDVLGCTEIDVRVVDVTSIVAGEYAENEIRKDFTPSERVAISVAVREDLARRHGSNQHSRKEVGHGAPPSTGKSRDLAAREVGFDSARQLDRASNVVRLGTPKLIAAMDAGDVSITAAADIAKAPAAEQAAVMALDLDERRKELWRRKDDGLRVRASAREQEELSGPTAYTQFLLKNGRLPSADEAKTIAALDFRETPSADGRRHAPGPKSTKVDRARAKAIDGYHDALWRTRQALQLLAHNDMDPAVLMQHARTVDRELITEHLRHGRAWLNRFAKEWTRD